MGVIRILLAIAVVIGHSKSSVFGFKYINGLIAVQSFFIISGFYMSLILNEKYNGKKILKLFISNRLLRLFPTYFFVIIITLIAAVIFNAMGHKQLIISDFSKLSCGSQAYLAITNIVIVGQEIACFMGFDAHGSMHYVKHYYDA